MISWLFIWAPFVILVLLGMLYLLEYIILCEDARNIEQVTVKIVPQKICSKKDVEDFNYRLAKALPIKTKTVICMPKSLEKYNKN